MALKQTISKVALIIKVSMIIDICCKVYGMIILTPETSTNICPTSTLVVISHERKAFSMFVSYVFSRSGVHGLTHTQVVQRYACDSNTSVAFT